MAPTIEWMSKVKEEMGKSPLASHFCFGIILVVLEKIVEMEFSCPCRQPLSKNVVLAFFLAPVLIVLILMLTIQAYKCEDCKSCCKSCCECCCEHYCEPCCESCCKYFKAFLHSLVPAMLWVVILFIDGRYYACAKTSWTGKYEVLEKAPFHRWCNPSNSSLDYVTHTQKWYTNSQTIGICVASGLAVLCLFIFCLKKINC